MTAQAPNSTHSEELTALIKKYDDWRGQMLEQVRDLINQAEPQVEEAVKWKTPSNPDGVAAWSKDGMICTGEVYKKHLRLSFAKGPQLNDPHGLINSYRAVLIHQDDTLDPQAFKELIHQAVELSRK